MPDGDRLARQIGLTERRLFQTAFRELTRRGPIVASVAGFSFRAPAPFRPSRLDRLSRITERGLRRIGEFVGVPGPFVSSSVGRECDPTLPVPLPDGTTAPQAVVDPSFVDRCGPEALLGIVPGTAEFIDRATAIRASRGIEAGTTPVTQPRSIAGAAESLIPVPAQRLFTTAAFPAGLSAQVPILPGSRDDPFGFNRPVPGASAFGPGGF